MQVLKTYKNLWIGLGTIFGITFFISHVYYNFPFGSMMDMQILMGIWFLMFGIMKLGNIKIFSDMFARYDPLAKHIHPYGKIYPFLEIILGGAYLWDISMKYTILINSIVIIMTVMTSIGIIQSLYKKKSETCMCMGSSMTTPLGRPSLIEQLSMCLMAIWMISMMM